MTFVAKRLERTRDISRGDQSWVSFLKNSLSVIIVLALGYLALGALAEGLARTIPDRWEERLFTWDAEPVTPEKLERAQLLFDRLRDRRQLRALPYRLHLVPEEGANAFAFPGGAIGLTEGLLDSLETDEGLAMVLGHELGHHERRDPLRALGRTALFSLSTRLLFGSDGRSLVKSSLSLADARYSREQEREADAFGLRLVHETFGDTSKSLEFFEKLQADPELIEHRWASFLQSHPLTSDRLDNLHRLQATLQRGTGTNLDRGPLGETSRP